MGQSQRVFAAILVAAVLASAAAVQAAAAGCARRPAGATLTVGAASSTRFALEEIAAAYERETGREITLVFGSSGDLARQIEAGAPLDLFIAADRRHVERLLGSGRLAAGSERVYATGRIVLATSKNTARELSWPDDLLSGSVDRIAIANPNHSPYGRAAREALQAVGLWEQIEGKIVYGETVGQVLQFVQSGNVSAGIIALALAGAPDITCTTIDHSLHSPLEQLLGIVDGSPRAAEAAAFVEFLTGPAGGAILERYSFLVPGLNENR